MKWSKSRKLSLATSMVTIIIVSLVSLLVIVPVVFGEQFVSFLFQPKPRYAGDWPKRNAMEIVLPDGRIIPISFMMLEVNVTNSYFVPVQVSYNGFDFVMLIYNRTVTDPEDIVGNKDFLVWGAFYTSYPIKGWGMYGFDWWDTALGNMTGYEYYATHKDFSNYTKTIRVGTYRQLIFYLSEWFPISYWYGQDLHGLPVSPGTYYIYCIAYGKVVEPFNLTVTSVLWSP